MKKVVLGAFLFLLTLSASGQYHLSELGLSLGPGVAIPVGYSKITPNAGLNLNAFFSHYVCGKRHGYHAVLGIRNFMATGKPGLSYPPITIPTRSRLSFTYVDVGFFFKIRRQIYHRNHETALLVGIKADVLAGSTLIVDLNGSPIRNDAFKEVFPFQPGGHLSFWFKRKILTQSWYLQPGVEYYFVPQLTTIDGSMAQVYIFLNFGVTFWNTKHTGFKHK